MSLLSRSERQCRCLLRSYAPDNGGMSLPCMPLPHAFRIVFSFPLFFPPDGVISVPLPVDGPFAAHLPTALKIASLLDVKCRGDVKGRGG